MQLRCMMPQAMLVLFCKKSQSQLNDKSASTGSRILIHVTFGSSAMLSDMNIPYEQVPDSLSWFSLHGKLVTNQSDT